MHRAGVTILDHSPALELLTTGDGVVATGGCAARPARPDIRAAMRTSQPNYFLPLNKAGIDPFTQKYPVRAVLEGTVGGTGGIRITGTDCATDVPDGVRGAGAAGLRGPSARRQASRAIVGLVQEHTLPLRRSYRRSATSLQDSVTALDEAWSGAADLLGGSERELLQARSAAAMLAAARWATHSALARTETRGMHVRTDLPDTDPAQTRRLLSGGLGEVWVRPEHGTAETRTVAS